MKFRCCYWDKDVFFNTGDNEKENIFENYCRVGDCCMDVKIREVIFFFVIFFSKLEYLVL